MQGYFITGTDTDVGKTVITAGLLRGLIKSGIDAVAVKPVQTGCLVVDKKLVAGDVQIYADAIAESCLDSVPIECVYKYEPACSPHLAADMCGDTIELERIVTAVEKHVDRVVLVEGAGGIHVPLNKHESMIDLMKRLGLPIILVVANRLGAINHALLSIEVLKYSGLEIAGIVFNEVSSAVDEHEQKLREENKKVIANLSGVSILGDVEYNQQLSNSDWNKITKSLGSLVDEIKKGSGSVFDNTELLNYDQEHLWHPYTSATNPLPAYQVVSASGTELRLANGQKIIDGMASWWCTIHGYNNPELNSAVVNQLNKMSHVMFGGITHEPAVELTRRLLEIVPKNLEYVFLADSGSVSVEVAIKMAIQYFQSTGEVNRNKLLTVRGGYHGDTLAAMSVCDPINGMHQLFSGILPEQIFAEKPSCRFDGEFDSASLDDISLKIKGNSDKIAAVILEPIVQGAGGMWFYHPEFLKGVRRLCDEHGVLLILDEIATGFGRTGKMFACEWAGIQPDIMCVGKSITGGYMTLAATIASAKVAHGISDKGGVFMHGPTFMGNPLACAVACKSLDLLSRDDMLSNVKDIERWLVQGLDKVRDFESVEDVRVLGAIGVVQMKEPVDVGRIQKYFVSHGVWIRPFGKLVYIMPPFISKKSEIEKLTSVIYDAICENAY